jgi:uncharacterized protein YxjI
MTPKLIVEQKITALVNKYAVYQSNPDGTKGTLIALAQQKRLAFKEKVNFYSDESRTTLVFSFRAEKVLDVHGRFFVEDSTGMRIGAFRKDFAKSLLSSTWHILDQADATVMTVRESNDTVAAFRRFAGYIPIVGDLADVAMAFIKYHFTFRSSDGQEHGTYQKTTLLRDHYTLLFDETFNQYDWRVLASIAVALDALQSR